MYSAVKTNDCAFTDIEMDDRESLYFDTISVSGSEPNSKSLSMSRQTIYHSTVDLPMHENAVGTPRKETNQTNAASSCSNSNSRANTKQKTPPCRRQSTLLDIGDTRDNPPLEYDEVHFRLIDNSNKIKKLPITYSQWRSRTWRRFQDGERSVDFVLAYRGDDTNPQNCRKRQTFETNLEKEGLELEREKTQKVHFVKIHAPIEVLCRYCEILKMKLPIKKVKEQDNITEPEFQLLSEMKSFFGKPFEFVKLDKTLFPEKEYSLLLSYERHYDYLFDTADPNFFDSSLKSSIINFILERQRFCNDNDMDNQVGIEKMLADKIYDAAYPLHDGDCDSAGSQRNLLLNEWASVKKCLQHQPLDNIKDYFGVKIAMYFAWLGFYAHMLIPASIVGVICFIYGLVNLSSDKLSEDICDYNNTIIMCPQCDTKCDYWRLRETCTYSKVNYLFDNNMTIVFALFMSFWATLYMELWKRYSAILMHRWGLTNYSHEVEHPQPQYLARLRQMKKTKFNVVHRVLEPHVPYWKMKFPMYVISFSSAFLFVCVAIAAVFGLVVYRMSQTTSHNIYGNTDSMSYKIMVLPATAAILNLIVITILNYAYDYLALYLTTLEYCRTQTEYDESLTLKIYLFQFVNYYSSIFYIAFLKGKFVGYPAKYNRIFTLRQEECGPGGCLMELCIQLVIIMIGNQIINACIEMLVPYLTKSYNNISQSLGLNKKEDRDNLIACNQWTEDYKLLPWPQLTLFNEYLEMVIQYGFITIFVVAFPLAPLFALVNNVLELRLDAKKFLKYYRRPVAQRVKDIGVWYNIMAIVGTISVASSAFIIAFSSNLIPKLVYKYSINPNHTYDGYLNHTLAYFDTRDFQQGTAPAHSAFENVTVCRYSEYRNPPWVGNPYKRPLVYWHILAARLAFIVIFQNVVGFIKMVFSWAIPDVPGRLRYKVKREEFLTQEIIIEHEKRRLKQSISENHNTNHTTPLLEKVLLRGEGKSQDLNSDIELRKRRENANLVERTSL